MGRFKAEHPDGIQYSRFCERYRAFRQRLDVVMRQSHRAGDERGRRHSLGIHAFPRREGKMHGRCVIQYADGGGYEGECLDGEAHGQGVSVAPDGQRYESGFRDGQPHGHGMGTTPDGGGCEGQWRQGQPHGKGVVTYPDGQRCEGEWRDGKRHGPA